MQHSLYHSLLKVSALSFALVLLFDSGLLSVRTKELSDQTGHYLANTIGVTAGVRPTELNEFTAALTQKEQELKEREAALTEREIAVNLSTGERAGDSSSRDLSTYVMSTILFILLVLIVLNYILDFIRQNREEAFGQPSTSPS